MEIALLEVRDYLKPDGGVRRESQVRAEVAPRAPVAIAGKVRPLHFASTKHDTLLGPYLQERAEQEFRRGRGRLIWGPEPEQPLIPVGRRHGLSYHALCKAGQRRHLCRAILEAHCKLFRYSGLKDVTSLSVRHVVASRLHDRGANEDQVNLLLGEYKGQRPLRRWPKGLGQAHAVLRRC